MMQDWIGQGTEFWIQWESGWMNSLLWRLYKKMWGLLECQDLQDITQMVGLTDRLNVAGEEVLQHLLVWGFFYFADRE